MGVTYTNRRLHQMMFADRDYERVDRGRSGSAEDKFKPLVTVHNCLEKVIQWLTFCAKIDQSFYLILYAH